MIDNTPIDPVVRDDLNDMYGDIENVVIIGIVAMIGIEWLIR